MQVLRNIEEDNPAALLPVELFDGELIGSGLRFRVPWQLFGRRLLKAASILEAALEVVEIPSDASALDAHAGKVLQIVAAIHGRALEQRR